MTFESAKEYGEHLAKICTDSLAKGNPTTNITCMDMLEYLKVANDLFTKSSNTWTKTQPHDKE